MPEYSISYDLSESNQEKYNRLENKISSYCSKSVKYSETSWIVKSSGNVTNLYNQLNPILSEYDTILIVKITGDYYGQLSPDFWPKIREVFK